MKKEQLYLGKWIFPNAFPPYLEKRDNFCHFLLIVLDNREPQ